MANITANPAAGRLSGAIGDLVFVRLKNGKVIVRRRPVRKTGKRAGEIANQEAFIRAVAVWTMPAGLAPSEGSPAIDWINLNHAKLEFTTLRFGEGMTA